MILFLYCADCVVCSTCLVIEFIVYINSCSTKHEIDIVHFFVTQEEGCVLCLGKIGFTFQRIYVTNVIIIDRTAV